MSSKSIGIVLILVGLVLIGFFGLSTLGLLPSMSIISDVSITSCSAKYGDEGISYLTPNSQLYFQASTQFVEFKCDESISAKEKIEKLKVFMTMKENDFSIFYTDQSNVTVHIYGGSINSTFILKMFKFSWWQTPYPFNDTVYCSVWFENLNTGLRTPLTVGTELTVEYLLNYNPCLLYGTTGSGSLAIKKTGKIIVSSVVIDCKVGLSANNKVTVWSNNKEAKPFYLTVDNQRLNIEVTAIGAPVGVGIVSFSLLSKINRRVVFSITLIGDTAKTTWTNVTPVISTVPSNIPSI